MALLELLKAKCSPGINMVDDIQQKINIITTNLDKLYETKTRVMEKNSVTRSTSLLWRISSISQQIKREEEQLDALKYQHPEYFI